MHALVRFAQIPAANTFSTREIHPYVAAAPCSSQGQALGARGEQCGLAALRYDLSKLRAKGLVEKLPRSRRYRLPAPGYSVCLIVTSITSMRRNGQAGHSVSEVPVISSFRPR